ncbi:hypothetical protein, partial [Staphylococcus aureus]
MRQFGHVREVTFEGYAGSVEAGFRDEVEAARAAGKMRDLIDMYTDVKAGARLGGPMGAKLEADFRHIAEVLGDLPGKVVDEKRLAQMLKNVAREVYPALINDCFFDAATARCLKRPEVKSLQKPYFAQCDWTKCPNSCFWRKHKPMIERSLAEAVEYRKRPRISKNQRLALDSVIAQYRRALKQTQDD